VGTVVKEITRQYDFTRAPPPPGSGGKGGATELGDDDYVYRPSDVAGDSWGRDEAGEGESAEEGDDDAGGGRRGRGRRRGGGGGLRRASGLADDDSFDSDGHGSSDEEDGEEENGSVAAAEPAPHRVTKAGVPFREQLSLLTDLDAHGASMTVARGGDAGVGNRGSNLFYADQLRATGLKPHVRGARGEVRLLELELKSIADIGLVGFPNAGKSSFLGAVSKVRARVWRRL
jgi:hypothetical protein